VRPQLELTPELKDLKPLLEAGDATGPSFASTATAIQLFVSHALITSGQVDQFLPFRGCSGKSFVFCLYIDASETPGEPDELALDRTFVDVASAIDVVRRSSDLPVNEVAEMVGLSRRGLYKIIKEGRTAASTEEHIYRVAAAVSELLEQLGEPQLVRTALLTPLRELDDRTFVEIAGTRDEADIRVGRNALLGAGKAAIEKRWQKTRPLSDSGDTVSRFIHGSVERSE
jgi:hypothetical protein